MSLVEAPERGGGSIPERMLRALEALVVLTSRLAPERPSSLGAEPRQQAYDHDNDVTQIAGQITRGKRRKFFVQNRGGQPIVIGPSSVTPSTGIRVNAGEFLSDDVAVWQGTWYFRTVADVIVVGDQIVVREELE